MTGLSIGLSDGLRPGTVEDRPSFFFEFKIEILVSLVIFSFLMSDVIVQNLTTIEPNILVFYELDDLN